MNKKFINEIVLTPTSFRCYIEPRINVNYLNFKTIYFRTMKKF